MKLRQTLLVAVMLAASMARAAATCSVSANIDTRDYTLNVSSTHGTPVPGVGSNTYAWRASVTASVDAVVSDGGTVRNCTGWTGSGSVALAGSASSTGPIVLTDVNSSIVWAWDLKYTVQFDLGSGSRSGGGALNQQVEHGAYAQEPIVTVPAGYRFVRWDTTLGPITSGRTITAVYEKSGSYWHTVSFNLGQHGTRTGGGELSQQVAHAHGAVAPNVVADTGWIVAGWSATFSAVLANLEIFAIYSRDPAFKQLSVISPYGDPTPAAGAFMHAIGAEVACSMPQMVISNAAAIHTCIGWRADNGSSGTGSTAPLNMAADVVLTWIWETQYYLTVNTSGAGSVDVTSGYYPAGNVVTLTATPLAGNEFQSWSGAASGMNPVAEISISGAKSVTAAFGEHLVESQILELSPTRTLIDSAVTFRGKAEASGGATITHYRWRMVKLLNGVESGALIELSDQSVFIRDDLPEGRWRVYFDAQDSTGVWSAAQTGELRLENPAFLTDLAIERADMRFFQENGSELDAMMANQVRVGDWVSVKITVRNLGGLNATNAVVVSLFDGKGPADLESHAEDLGLLGTNVISAIPAGGSVQTVVEWHVGYDAAGNALAGWDGTFRLITALAEFKVNRDQAALNAAGAGEELPIYEATLMNNAGQSSVLIGEVALGDYTMSVTVPQVSVKEKTEVFVQGSARYEWMDGGASNGDAVLGAVVQVMIGGRVLTAKTCAPDGRFSINAGYLPVGVYKIQAQVDDGALSASAVSEVRVNALEIPPPPQAELSVAFLEVVGPGMYGTESTMAHTVLASNVTISATIQNTGDLTAMQPFTVRFYVNESSNEVGKATVTTSLNPGASSFVVCPAIWSTNVVGTYSIYAEVDADHQVDEKNESNNLKSIAVAVHEGKPDLRPYYVSGQVVHTLSISPADPVQGQILSLAVDVFNSGPVPMTEDTFNVAFYIDGVLVSETNVTAALVCGESVHVERPWDTSVVFPGMYSLSVVVDRHDEIEEDFENNNTAESTFELLPAVPALVLEEIVCRREWLYTGETLILTAVIRNAGGADYVGGSTIWLCENSLDSTVSGSPVGPLAIGRTTSINISWQAPETPGPMLLLLHLDGVVKKLDMPVCARDQPRPPQPPSADPGLYSQDISIPGDWTRGDRVAAQAEVHNLGNLPATNILAQFYYSIDSVGYVPLGMAQLIDLLPAGATTSLLSTATFEAIEPYYTVKVRLTPSGGNKLTANDIAKRSFAIEAPWADAGNDRITVIGHSVALDGTASQYATAYSWEFSAMPVGSAAVLSEADTAQPSFVPDLPGTYEVRLQVSDGKLYSPFGWARVIARVPVAATLTVASIHSDPVPSVGTHDVMVGHTISASAEDVMSGGTNWVCTGWYGSGITPESGATNSVDILVVDEQAELRWQWATNYLVDAGLTGLGSVTGESGYFPVGTQMAYRATAEVGFVFAEWIGDVAGCIVNADQIEAPVDQTRKLTASFLPVPVTNLTARVKSLESVQLAWLYNGLSSATYRVERLTGGETEWRVIGSTDGTTFVDNKATEGMSMFYRVSAVIGSCVSMPIGTQAEVPNLPSSPKNVGAMATLHANVSISWKPALYATGYDIQRRDLPLGEWVAAASVGNVQNCSDTAVTAGGRYAYRVRSVNAAGNSAYSGEVYITVPLAQGSSAWNYGLSVSNAVVTVAKNVLDPAGNVLCGTAIGGIFDALLSNPSGESVQHRVVAGLRDTDGVPVGTVVEINELTGVPLAPPEWASDVTIPEGLSVPSTPGTYILWIEDFLGESDPRESFVLSTHTNEMELARKAAEFTAVAPQASDASVILGTEAERAGQTVDVPIAVSAMGGENVISFSLSYDSSKIKFLNFKSDKGAGSSYLEVNDLIDGSVGVLMILPVDAVLGSGVQIIATAKFQVNELAPADSVIELTFSDTPTVCAVLDAFANEMPHVWCNGSVTVVGDGYEADVSPRGNPDGAVDDKDKKQMLRFATGLDTPAMGSEFQRADCAPIDTRGDGRVDVRDVVVATSYADGVEPLKVAGGPYEPVPEVKSLFTQAPVREYSRGLMSVLHTDMMSMGLAGLLIIDANYAVRGELLEVPIKIVSGGNVEGVSFSVCFDPSQLTYLDAEVSSSCSGSVGVLNAERATSGIVGFALRMPQGVGVAAGATKVLTLRFRVSPAASDLVTQMKFVEGTAPIVLSDGAGMAVNASVQGASIYLVPKNDQGAPEAVLNLTASLETSERVRLNWSDVTDETVYKLYRRSDNEIWGLLAELPAGTESYIDSGLLPGVTYAYRVVTVNDISESSSDPVTITVPTRYSYWASKSIGFSQAEPSSDADGDGIRNYLEFLMGSNPVIPESGLLRMGYEDLYGLGENYFILSLDVNDWAVDFVSAETTGDLSTGEWLSAVELGSSVSNGVRRMKFRTQQPMRKSPHQFIRLKTKR